jgi:cytochrome c oxidase subunit 3
MWINSLLLVLSSCMLEITRRTMTSKEEFAVMGIIPPTGKREIPWLGITVFLGFCFLAGQVLVWKNLQQQGAFSTFNPSRPMFYLVTGAHAVHLLFGLIALLYVALGPRLWGMRFDSQRIAVEVTSWYWHYLTLLWFGIFALVYFARG